MNAPQLVTIHRTANEAEAVLVQGQLTQAGIPATCVYNRDEPVYGQAINRLGQYHVLVSQNQVHQARAVLARTRKR